MMIALKFLGGKLLYPVLFVLEVGIQAAKIFVKVIFFKWILTLIIELVNKLGDSGGGAAWNNHGQWIQVGIVSFVSSKGCAHGHPSGFTRVTSYLQWISQNSGIALRNWFIVFTSC